MAERTIRKWMDGFKNLYFDADENRSPTQIWIATMAHSSNIGEAIRRLHFKYLLDSASHFFCWMCSFVNKCNSLSKNNLFSYEGCLSDMVSAKYPNVCGHCLETVCNCRARDMDSVNDKSAHYRELYDSHKKHFNHERQTFTTWLEIFDKIYGQRIHVQSLESIGFHFVEEAGECARAVRNLDQLEGINHEKFKIGPEFIESLTSYETLLAQYEAYSKTNRVPKKQEPNYKVFFTSLDPEHLKSRIVHAKMDLVIEMGDTFSWFCSTINKTGQISKAWTEPDSHYGPKIPAMEFEEKLCKEYTRDGEFICPICDERKCICSFVLKN